MLAAERQEGLRQVILETVDLAHTQAFRRILRLILEHNLTRFSATIRAASVWLGLPFDVGECAGPEPDTGTGAGLPRGPALRSAAIDQAAAQAVYLALWASALDDAVATVDRRPLADDSDAERRFAATYLLAQLGTVGAIMAIGKALDDTDLRVVLAALLLTNPSSIIACRRPTYSSGWKGLSRASQNKRGI